MKIGQISLPPPLPRLGKITLERNPGPRWLSDKDRVKMEAAYGYYATRRAEAFAPMGNVEIANLLAERMSSRVLERYGAASTVSQKATRRKPKKEGEVKSGL